MFEKLLLRNKMFRKFTLRIKILKNILTKDYIFPRKADYKENVLKPFSIFDKFLEKYFDI